MFGTAINVIGRFSLRLDARYSDTLGHGAWDTSARGPIKLADLPRSPLENQFAPQSFQPLYRHHPVGDGRRRRILAGLRRDGVLKKGIVTLRILIDGGDEVRIPGEAIRSLDQGRLRIVDLERRIAVPQNGDDVAGDLP